MNALPLALLGVLVLALALRGHIGCSIKGLPLALTLGLIFWGFIAVVVLAINAVIRMLCEGLR